jgi:diguanylate cyclase (GGDEF)-like protein
MPPSRTSAARRPPACRAAAAFLATVLATVLAASTLPAALRAQDDPLARARALAREAALYQTDRPARAVAAGAEALRLLGGGPDDPPRAALRVAAQADVAMAYVWLGRYDSAATAAQSARALAARRGDRLGVAHALGSLGALAQRQGDPERAARHLEEALTLQRAARADSAAASTLNFVGFIYATDLADYDRALSYQLESLRIRERLGHPGPLATTLNSLGVVYGRLREYDRAHAYYARALATHRALGDSGGTTRAAATLSNMGDLRLEQGDPAGALAHHRESLRLREAVGDRWSRSLGHRNVGLALLALGRRDAAQTAVAAALRLGEGTANRGLAVRNQLALAAVERAHGRPRAAERAAAAARALAAAMGSRELTRRAWEALADAQEAGGRPAEALASYRHFKAISDSVLNADMGRRVAALEERSAGERRERQVEQLRHAHALSALQARERAAQRNALGAVALALALAGAAAYRRRSREARRAEALSLTDPLTGARNRRYVRERAAHAGGAPAAYLLVDVDHFKQVNDTHGHGAGDRVLAELAGVLQRACGPDDTVVRWGGEEFLVLCAAAGRDVGAAAERLRAAVAAHTMTLDGGASLRVRCSIGYALVPRAAGAARWGWEAGVALADHALYAAKQRGRDAWVGYAPGTRPPAPPAHPPTPDTVAAWLAGGALVRRESAAAPARSAA